MIEGIDSYVQKNTILFFKNKCRRKFTPQEDLNLKTLIEKFSTRNWDIISQFMPGRTAKQCRDRYCNYLSEEHSNEPWNAEEDAIIMKFFLIVGPKWSTIAKYIPKRSGNDVKNRWHKHISKNYSHFLNNINVVPLQNSVIVNNSSTIEIQPKKSNDRCNELYEKYSISSLLL